MTEVLKAFASHQSLSSLNLCGISLDYSDHPFLSAPEELLSLLSPLPLKVLGVSQLKEEYLLQLPRLETLILDGSVSLNFEGLASHPSLQHLCLRNYSPIDKVTRIRSSELPWEASWPERLISGAWKSPGKR